MELWPDPASAANAAPQLPHFSTEALPDASLGWPDNETSYFVELDAEIKSLRRENEQLKARVVDPSSRIGPHPWETAALTTIEAAWAGVEPSQESLYVFPKLSIEFWARTAQPYRNRLQDAVRTYVQSNDEATRGAIERSVRGALTLRERVRRVMCIMSPGVVGQFIQMDMGALSVRGAAAVRQRKIAAVLRILALTPEQVEALRDLWESYCNSLRLMRQNTASLAATLGAQANGSAAAADNDLSLRACAERSLETSMPATILNFNQDGMVIYDRLVAGMMAVFSWRQAVAVALELRAYGADFVEICHSAVAGDPSLERSTAVVNIF